MAALGWRPVPGERQAQQLSPSLGANTEGGSATGRGVPGEGVGEGAEEPGPEVMLTWVVRLEEEGGGGVDFLWCRTGSGERHGTGCDHGCGPDVRPPPSPLLPSQQAALPPCPLPSQPSAVAKSGSEAAAPPTPISTPTLTLPSLPQLARPHTWQQLIGLATGGAVVGAFVGLAIFVARAYSRSQISEQPGASRTISKRDGAAGGATRRAAGWRWVRPLVSFRSRRGGWRSFSDEPSQGAELSQVGVISQDV